MKYICIYIGLISTLQVFANKERWDTNKNEWTPLMCTIYYKCLECRNLLIEQGTNINQVSTKYNLTALDVAIRTQDSSSVKALLDTKQVQDIDKYMISACSLQDSNIVKLLIDNGANPNISLENNYSPLMAAVSFGSKENIIVLAQHKVDINQQRKTDGMTALMLAVFNNDLEKIKYLLKFGANKDIKDWNGNKAVNYITINKEVSIPEKLINEMRYLFK